MSRCIFWKDGGVFIFERVWVEEARREGLTDLLCVDEVHIDPKDRYGLFHSTWGWGHIPLEDFPKEFRLHLLLMGVA